MTVSLAVMMNSSSNLFASAERKELVWQVQCTGPGRGEIWQQRPERLAHPAFPFAVSGDIADRDAAFRAVAEIEVVEPFERMTIRRRDGDWLSTSRQSWE
jgi:hypothetical protein